MEEVNGSRDFIVVVLSASLVAHLGWVEGALDDAVSLGNGGVIRAMLFFIGGTRPRLLRWCGAGWSDRRCRAAFGGRDSRHCGGGIESQ